MWDIRLDMRNKAGFTIAIAFGREMATNRKMGGVGGERGREGEGYRTMTILRALAWSQPTQGNTCSRLAGYDRCHWLAKLPPFAYARFTPSLFSLSLFLSSRNSRDSSHRSPRISSIGLVSPSIRSSLFLSLFSKQREFYGR